MYDVVFGAETELEEAGTEEGELEENVPPTVVVEDTKWSVGEGCVDVTMDDGSTDEVCEGVVEDTSPSVGIDIVPET